MYSFLFEKWLIEITFRYACQTCLSSSGNYTFVYLHVLNLLCFRDDIVI